MGPRLRGDDDEERALPPPDEGDAAPPSPDPSPPPADLAGGGESTPAAATDAAGACADLSNLAPDARLARLSEMARVIDFQLALLRHKQAHPQRGEDTKAINADVKNFAATAALIEHQLQKLEGVRSTPMPNQGHDGHNDDNNDDIPEDIDAFRLRLAAKIEDFLHRRPDIGDGDPPADQGRGPARP
jgi:hypothetical protein